MTILGPAHILQHVAGDQLAAAIIVVWIIGLEHTQPVLNGKAGCDDKKATAKA
jgi:hypothetical protein